MVAKIELKYCQKFCSIYSKDISVYQILPEILLNLFTGYIGISNTARNSAQSIRRIYRYIKYCQKFYSIYSQDISVYQILPEILLNLFAGYIGISNTARNSTQSIHRIYRYIKYCQKFCSIYSQDISVYQTPPGVLVNLFTGYIGISIIARSSGQSFHRMYRYINHRQEFCSIFSQDVSVYQSPPGVLVNLFTGCIGISITARSSAQSFHRIYRYINHRQEFWSIYWQDVSVSHV